MFDTDDKVNAIDAARFMVDYMHLPDAIFDKLYGCTPANRAAAFKASAEVILKFITGTVGPDESPPADPHAPIVAQMQAEYRAMQNNLVKSQVQISALQGEITKLCKCETELKSGADSNAPKDESNDASYILAAMQANLEGKDAKITNLIAVIMHNEKTIDAQAIEIEGLDDQVATLHAMAADDIRPTAASDGKYKPTAAEWEKKHNDLQDIRFDLEIEVQLLREGNEKLSAEVQQAYAVRDILKEHGCISILPGAVHVTTLVNDFITKLKQPNRCSRR